MSKTCEAASWLPPPYAEIAETKVKDRIQEQQRQKKRGTNPNQIRGETKIEHSAYQLSRIKVDKELLSKVALIKAKEKEAFSIALIVQCHASDFKVAAK